MTEEFTYTSFQEKFDQAAVHNTRFVGKAVNDDLQLSELLDIPQQLLSDSMLVLGLLYRELSRAQRSGNPSFMEDFYQREKLAVIRCLDNPRQKNESTALLLISNAFLDLFLHPDAFRKHFWNVSPEFKPSKKLLEAWSRQWYPQVQQALYPEPSLLTHASI
ncbi:hypothetical protein M1349_05075 [Patescibacteria group bacterium]|nr:hypothetical protein [Patescibacteria group bacterium]